MFPRREVSWPLPPGQLRDAMERRVWEEKGAQSQEMRMWRVLAGGKDQLSVHSQWAAGRQGTKGPELRGQEGKAAWPQLTSLIC